MTPTDIQSLTRDYYPTAYNLQLQAEELAAANADDFDGYTDWSEDIEAIRLEEANQDCATPDNLDEGAQALVKKPYEHPNRRSRHLMTCNLCSKAIKPNDVTNLHHPVYRSKGGVATEPTHQECHIAYHSIQGDFQAFGRIGGQISATTKRWSFNLKNVKDHPAYELSRQFYRAHYAH